MKKLLAAVVAVGTALGLFVEYNALAGAWLPSEYQGVEYVESTGAQYINTGIVPCSGTRVVIELALAVKPTANAFCGWGSSGNKEAFKKSGEAESLPLLH